MMSAELEFKAKVTGRETVPPDAAGVLRAISRIGYRLPEAIADLVDNSVDASAEVVLIRFFKTGDDLSSIAVVDNGSGMDEKTLNEAMRFGSRSDHKSTDLGKYGMGLKSASLNHADAVTVITSQRDEVHARRWTATSIAEDWKLETLDTASTSAFLDREWAEVRPRPSGTIVLWQQMERFTSAPGRAGQRFGQYKRQIALHLGLVFHRMISAKRLRIAIDLQDTDSGDVGLPHIVEPLDPFPAVSGAKGYPLTYYVPLETYGTLQLKAQIWPARARDPGYKLDGRVAQRQGLYFYRNDRLIQAGGWNGWRNDAEPHASLARAAIDLPSSFDEAFAVNVQKSGVDAPQGFQRALDQARAGNNTLADYLRTADDVYRSAGGDAKPVPSISGGLRKPARVAINEVLRDGAAPSVPVEISWNGLRGDTVFEIDQEKRRIVLNSNFRHDLLGDERASVGDLPVLKTLLFLLVAEDVIRGRMSKRLTEKLDRLNDCLLLALEDQIER